MPAKRDKEQTPPVPRQINYLPEVIQTIRKRRIKQKQKNIDKEQEQPPQQFLSKDAIMENVKRMIEKHQELREKEEIFQHISSNDPTWYMNTQHVAYLDQLCLDTVQIVTEGIEFMSYL